MTGLRVADDVAWVQDGSDAPLVAAGLVPDGEPLLLHGSSAQIWVLLAETGDPTEVVDVLHEAYDGVGREEIAAAVDHFVADLVARGLVVREAQSPRSPDSSSASR